MRQAESSACLWHHPCVQLLFSLSLLLQLVATHTRHVQISEVSAAEDEVSLLQLQASTKSLTRPTQHACNNAIAVPGSTVPMPSRGFVTCCRADKMIQPVMKDYLVRWFQVGGRRADTCNDYGDTEISIREAVQEAGIPREDLWLSSKIATNYWSPSNGSARAWSSAMVDQTLSRMGLSYLDQVVLHFGPAQLQHMISIGWPAVHHPLAFSDYTEMYLGLFDAQKAGKIRNIGVMDITQAEIQKLIDDTGKKPAIVMTSYSPWVPPAQHEYVRWVQSMNITVNTFSPFGWKHDPTSASRVLAAEKAAARHGVTWGQLVIQWLLEQNIPFVSALYHNHYQEEDLLCNPFKLDPEDHELLASAPAMDCLNWALGPEPLPGCAQMTG